MKTFFSLVLFFFAGAHLHAGSEARDNAYLQANTFGVDGKALQVLDYGVLVSEAEILPLKVRDDRTIDFADSIKNNHTKKRDVIFVFTNTSKYVQGDMVSFNRAYDVGSFRYTSTLGAPSKIAAFTTEEKQALKYWHDNGSPGEIELHGTVFLKLLDGLIIEIIQPTKNGQVAESLVFLKGFPTASTMNEGSKCDAVVRSVGKHSYKTPAGTDAEASSYVFIDSIK